MTSPITHRERVEFGRSTDDGRQLYGPSGMLLYGPSVWWRQLYGPGVI